MRMMNWRAITFVCLFIRFCWLNCVLVNFNSRNWIIDEFEKFEALEDVWKNLIRKVTILDLSGQKSNHTCPIMGKWKIFSSFNQIVIFFILFEFEPNGVRFSSVINFFVYLLQRYLEKRLSVFFQWRTQTERNRGGLSLSVRIVRIPDQLC